MADKMVTLPGIGPVKVGYVYAGAGVIAVAVIYAYWRSSRTTGTEVTGDEAAAEDTGTELGTDTAGSGFDYVNGAGAYDYGTGSSYPIYQYPNTSNTVTSTLPTTDAEWARAAREELEGEGAESAQASSAIGNYLAGLCVSAAEADLVRRANAMLGHPPQHTYSIITCPAKPPTTTPPPTGTKPPSGTSLKGPTGLHVLRTFSTEIQIGWTPVKGAAGYAVFRSDPASASSTWQRQTTSIGNSFQFKGLRKNTAYKFKIQTVGQDHKEGGSSQISARTKK